MLIDPFCSGEGKTVFVKPIFHQYMPLRTGLGGSRVARLVILSGDRKFGATVIHRSGAQLALHSPGEGRIAPHLKEACALPVLVVLCSGRVTVSGQNWKGQNL